MKTNTFYGHLCSGIRNAGAYYIHCIYLGLAITALLVACTSTSPSGPPPKIKKPQGNTAPVVPIVGGFFQGKTFPWTIAAISTGVLFYRSKTYGRYQRKLVAAIKAK